MSVVVPFLKVVGGNGFSEFIAVDSFVIQTPNGFTGCDGCEGMVWDGNLVNEVVAAPGQTISEDGRGMWQGAMTCANCTYLTVAAWQVSNENEDRFWQRREKFLAGPRSNFQSQAVERLIVL